MICKPVLGLSVLVLALSAICHNTTAAASVLPNAVTKPTITNQPVSISVKVGTTATFGVLASGTGPFTYTWYKNGYPIAGATAYKYTTPPTTDADNNSNFRVTVQNSAGSDTSNYAYLTVVDPPVIQHQPTSMVVTAPGLASFSIWASGSWPMTVQWYKNGTAIPGATQWEYSTAETTTADNGSYFQAVVKNVAGSVTSNKAIVTVKPYAGTGTYPIVGEWVGTATITTTGSGTYTSQAVAAFSQTSYALIGTMVFTDENGIPMAGGAVAALNNLNLFISPGESFNLAGGFSSNLLTLNIQAAGTDPGGEYMSAHTGTGTITISTDHQTLTGSGSDSDGDVVNWKLTRVK